MDGDTGGTGKTRWWMDTAAINIQSVNIRIIQTVKVIKEQNQF